MVIVKEVEDDTFFLIFIHFKKLSSNMFNNLAWNGNASSNVNTQNRD